MNSACTYRPGGLCYIVAQAVGLRYRPGGLCYINRPGGLGYVGSASRETTSIP